MRHPGRSTMLFSIRTHLHAEYLTVPRRIVVTGGGGFVGQWLTRELLRRGDEIWLADVRRGGGPMVLSTKESDAVRWATTDVRSSDQVRALFDESKPDVVIHLAGMSAIPQAERDPATAYDVNVTGSARMLGIAAQYREVGRIDPTILVVGSGTQYGTHEASENPLPETAEQRPANVYAATKCAQEIAALQIGRASGLRVVCTRSFGHAGAGQAPTFLFPTLVARARTLGGKQGSIRIGNNVVRDYLHVEDVVQAYLALVDRGESGEVYNVSAGIGISIKTIAELVASRAGVVADVITDPTLGRPSDPPILIGAPDKVRRATGWRPVKCVADIIDDLLRAS